MGDINAVMNELRTDRTEVDEAAFSELLSEFAGTLATDFPIQSILDHLVKRIVDLLPIDAAGVSLIAPDLAPRFVASSDATALRYEQLQTDLGQGPCVTAYLTGEAVPVPDLAEEKRFPAFAAAAVEIGLGAVFSFPLRHPGGQFGALDLYRIAAGPLGPRALQVAQTLADVTSAYLLNAQSREEALATSEQHRLLSLHDPLTGLPNRMLLQDRLQHAALRAGRAQTAAAVLFVDIDHFKSVNDRLGHQAGDQVLIAVAERLSHLVRASDTLARIAGDEFVLLCEELGSRIDAEMICARVRDAFAEPFFVGVGELAVTASVGMAYAAPGEPISEHLIAEADRAMYRAKAPRVAPDPGVAPVLGRVAPPSTSRSIVGALRSLVLSLRTPVTRTSIASPPGESVNSSSIDAGQEARRRRAAGRSR